MAAELRSIWRFMKRVYRNYQRDSGTLLASAVAFYALLSFVPLLSLGVSILGAVLGSDESALLHIEDSLRDVLPAGSRVVRDTMDQITKSSGIAGVVSLVGLLIPASAIFTNMEIAFNRMWQVKRMRSWLRQRLVALWVAAITISLMLLSIGITSLMTWVQNWRVPGFDVRAGEVPVVWQLVGHLLPIVLSILMFTLIYKIVPNREITWRQAFAGGLFAGLAWEAAKYLFEFYVAHFATFNKVYGSLGAIVTLIFWTLYSSIILFIGAEITACVGGASDARPADLLPQPQPRETEGEAS